MGGVCCVPNACLKIDITIIILVKAVIPKTREGKIVNAGCEDHSVLQIAETVRDLIGKDVTLKTTPTDDNRSYHVSSKKITEVLGFYPKHTIRDAVADLRVAFDKGLLPNSLEDERYYNIKRMQTLNLR